MAKEILRFAQDDNVSSQANLELLRVECCALSGGRPKAAETMGIRVYCPNGHKLNIKATQAGKRGICPHCGAKFLIPGADSTTESDDPDTPVSTLATVDPEGSEVDEATPAGAEGATGILPVPLAENTGQRPVAPVVRADGTASLPDPLAEVPEAVWYVRPSSGGQFGPAEADLMRTWLEEGRITGDSFVWREDWEDWVPASEVFAELPAAAEGTGPGEASKQPPQQAPTIEPRRAPEADSKQPASELVPPIGILAEPSRLRTSAQRRARRRRVNLVVALIVVVVLLGIVLVLVLSRS